MVSGRIRPNRKSKFATKSEIIGILTISLGLKLLRVFLSGRTRGWDFIVRRWGGGGRLATLR